MLQLFFPHRTLEYEINMLGQGNAGMMFLNPHEKFLYAVYQSRVYHVHAPRKITFGVNSQNKEVQLIVSRPEVTKPWMFFAHAQTSVMARTEKFDFKFPELKKHCPECENVVVISKRPAKGDYRGDYPLNRYYLFF